MFLRQEHYTNGNTSKPMPSHEIDAIATYQPLVDGFYHWWCGKCGKQAGSRAGWNIHGTVEYCTECHASNLLIRTDCELIDKGLEVLFELNKKPHGWMITEKGRADMVVPPVKVEVLDGTDEVPEAAQRIANSLAEIGWEGDITMTTLLASLLEQCGAKFDEKE